MTKFQVYRQHKIVMFVEDEVNIPMEVIVEIKI